MQERDHSGRTDLQIVCSDDRYRERLNAGANMLTGSEYFELGSSVEEICSLSYPNKTS